MRDLTYGPVGDPESKDPFEWAQARMPDGWHVEGQYLEAYFASRQGGSAFAWGYTPEALVDNVLNGRQHFSSWKAVRHGACLGTAVG